MTEEKKHAYLILCHNNFRQMAVLLRLLDDSRNDIFLHVDKKAGNFPEQELRGQVKRAELFFTRRVSVFWGDYSIVEAELILLEEAVKKADYAFLHLLSGQDLPLKTQEEIHRFFDENQGKEFIRFSENQSNLIRIRYYYPCMRLYGRNALRPMGFPLRAAHWALRSIQRGLGIDRLAGLSETFCYGHTWFSVTSAFAREILSRRDFIREHFKMTYAPDEHFVHTVAVNSPLRDNIVYDNQRQVNFADGAHPRVYTMADYDMLISCGKLFARKFDERQDFEIIQAIERHIMENTPGKTEKERTNDS